MRVLPRRVLFRSAVVAAAVGAVGAPTYAAATPASVAFGAVPASTSASARSSASSSASTSSCGASFTLKAKGHKSTKSRPLVDVRAGTHACYDRLVLEFRGPVNGYTIKYVNQVHEDGSGKPVPLAGRAKLQVTVVAPAYDSAGATYTPADRAHVVDVSGFQSFRQVAWAGSFEGYTTLGVGMRRGLPFRVLVLSGPGRHTRIAIDVAHNR